jgi:hypothetical protein
MDEKSSDAPSSSQSQLRPRGMLWRHSVSQDAETLTNALSTVEERRFSAA